MRAVITQVCQVCHYRTRSKAAMEEHIEERHGNNWPPGQLTRSADQMEFNPSMRATPWGKDFR